MFLRLKEIRENMGMTQHDVCRILNLQSSTYRNMEKNRFKKFDFVFLFKFKDLFHLDSIEDLFIIDKSE